MPNSPPKKNHTGIISVHPRGFGFVRLDAPSSINEDIFIPRHATKNAVDGDHVEVTIDWEAKSDKGLEGVIIAILERGRTHLAGILTQRLSEDSWGAYAPLLGKDKRIIVEHSEDFMLTKGMRLVLKVTDWGTKYSETRCQVSHLLGHIHDASVDVPAAIEEFELRLDFPSKVLEEAQKLPTRITAKDLEGRRDLRSLETFTIDPETAKDFDDALSLSLDTKGHYHLGVHIADVSHYIPAGSAIDEEAQLRSNSTYFPNLCIPMLPEKLANNLCSLRPKVVRLTTSVLMECNAEGDLIQYEIVRTAIKSQKRFTYEEAKDVLDDKKKSKHAKTLKLMVELCDRFKKRRGERGSVEFALPEVAVVVDENGNPLGVKRSEYDITHQLVEEFMLKANETVATHLNSLGKELSYRIHDVPSADDLKDFATTVRAYGHKMSDKATPEELQTLFREVRGTVLGQQLAVSYIRCMKLAIYSPENIGHYGLSLEHYCHFTSPIRRYVDLEIHRILFGEEMTKDKLHEISQRCTEQERVSAKAEQSVSLLKKLRLLSDIDNEDPHKQYDAVIAGIKPFGIIFDIGEYMIEGFIHVSEIGSDYFHYNPRSMQLIGDNTGVCYQCGDHVTVMVENIDLIMLESRWKLASAGGYPLKRKKKKKQRKRKRKERKSA